MKRTKGAAADSDDLAPEYDLDYSKSRPNPFAGRIAEDRLLDADVSQVFTTPEAVNAALRALMNAVPKSRERPSVRS